LFYFSFHLNFFFLTLQNEIYLIFKKILGKQVNLNNLANQKQTLPISADSNHPNINQIRILNLRNNLDEIAPEYHIESTYL
jgi:hypothetical protein